MTTPIHPNDRLWALERAVRLAEQHDPAIAFTLRQLLDEARQEARK